MSDGLAHCRSISVFKIFEMIKQLSNVIFAIFIALRIGIHNLTHARAMDTAIIPYGHLQTFPYCENRKFRENVVTARAESILLLRMAICFLRAFVIVPLTFYSSMRQSYDTGCASSSDVQFHRTLLAVLFIHRVLFYAAIQLLFVHFCIKDAKM